MINVLFRHGDRSPRNVYPNDPHINYTWPGGFGALSEIGSLQMYSLGTNLRKRYQSVLPSSGLYSKMDIQVVSSFHERCIMSAGSFLAAFIQPLKNRNLLPIAWQPIPIHIIPREQDHLIVFHRPCPKYDKLLNEIESTNPPDEIQKINQDNTDLYEYLTEHTGKNITTIFDVESLHNTLYIEHAIGLPLPNWTIDVFPNRTRVLHARAATARTETDYMRKIRGGPILTEFLTNMENYKIATTTQRKIHIYSGHDTTLVSLQRILNVTDQTTVTPDYAATMVFELHEHILDRKSIVNDNDDDDAYEVKIVYYKNYDVKEPKNINIPNCNAPCKLSDFKKSVKHLIVNDFDENCKF